MSHNDFPNICNVLQANIFASLSFFLCNIAT